MKNYGKGKSSSLDAHFCCNPALPTGRVVQVVESEGNQKIAPASHLDPETLANIGKHVVPRSTVLFDRAK